MIELSLSDIQIDKRELQPDSNCSKEIIRFNDVVRRSTNEEEMVDSRSEMVRLKTQVEVVCSTSGVEVSSRNEEMAEWMSVEGMVYSRSEVVRAE